jgi:hypothetical protein
MPLLVAGQPKWEGISINVPMKPVAMFRLVTTVAGTVTAPNARVTNAKSGYTNGNQN